VFKQEQVYAPAKVALNFSTISRGKMSRRSRGVTVAGSGCYNGQMKLRSACVARAAESPADAEIQPIGSIGITLLAFVIELAFRKKI
jgi:hypothetical protein